MNHFVRMIEMNAKLTPQMRKILNHCKRVGHITGRAAIIDYAIMALPRRISDLEERGYQVRREERQNPATGQRYVRYYVEEPGVAA